MKVKFTKRSKKDKDLVTLQLSQFGEEDLPLFPYYARSVGDEMIVVIEGIPTVFTFCRPNTDGIPTCATSRGFPRRFRLPTVGHPVYADVSEAY